MNAKLRASAAGPPVRFAHGSTAAIASGRNTPSSSVRSYSDADVRDQTKWQAEVNKLTSSWSPRAFSPRA